MTRPLPSRYVLTEFEPAKRYLLTREGQTWQKEFSTVAAAYFYARSLSDEGNGELVVVNDAGKKGTLFLF